MHLPSASVAGITALPTDPSVLLELGPVANSLASALPTSSVLAVLLTAAPSGFVSSIVNDPSYASDFASSFSAGNSPSWFNGLPTGVRSYLHTYSGFGGFAGAADAIQDVTAGAGSATSTTSGSSGSGSTTTMSSAASLMSAFSASAASATASVESNILSASAAGAGTSASSTGGAAYPTGAIAAGIAGMAGALGMAVAI